MQRTYVRAGDRVEIRPEHMSRATARPRESFDVFATRVSWSPVFAGVLCALTTMFLLASLGAAVGASTALDNGRPPGAGGLWAVISGLIAFALGGFIAGKLAHPASPGASALHGALVFMTAVPVVLWLAAQGGRTISFGGLPGTWTAFVGLVVALIASAIGGWLASSRPAGRR